MFPELEHRSLESCNLAWTYDRLGMADSARVSYHRYLDAPCSGSLNAGAFHLARAYERLRQLNEERGELEEAARFYALFIDLWKDADPELQPRVEAARRALGRLTTEDTR